MILYHKTAGMVLLDIHTHNLSADATTSILDNPTTDTARNISVGIHPWEIGPDWEREFCEIEQAAICRNVAAIGECGIDRFKSPADIRLQETVFRAHALLAEKVNKPIIIHCVKAYNEILSIHKDVSPEQPWIIHGYRGKPQQARQLVQAGMYLSFGEHFNAESARAIPTDRLFIESDESTLPIAEIYSRVAAAKGISIEELAGQINSNALIFGIF